MSFFYVVGPAGSGKSAICVALRERGVAAYDEDDSAIGSAHELVSGRPVDVPPVELRTAAWFEAHEWRVLEPALTELGRRAALADVVLCGNVLSDDQLSRLGATVVWLNVPDDVLKERLQGRTDNDYGKSDAELAAILDRRAELESRFAGRARVVDASAPLDSVVSELLGVVEAARCRRTATPELR